MDPRILCAIRDAYVCPARSAVILLGKGVKPNCKLQIPHSVSKLTTSFSPCAEDFTLRTYLPFFSRALPPDSSSHSSTPDL